MRLVFSFLLLFTAWLAEAQQYRFHQYRVEQGLPSDLVKATTQDSLGFFWIATDDGLVKYDGLKFTTYKSALRSQYTKGFHHTKNGRLLAFGDFDLVEIHNQMDTVVFTSILRGSRNPTDSTLWYPKSMYEDKEGNLWFAEPRSVVCFDGKAIQRFDLGQENRSPVFVRSFSFFEDGGGNLFAVSFQGRVFRHDREGNVFVEQSDFRLPEDISQVLFFKDKLLIAARDGLYTASLEGNEIMPPENIFPITQVSNLLLSPDSSIMVSTYGEDLYRVSFTDGFTWENLYYNFKGINSCYVSNEGDIWVATDRGLILIQKNLFVFADINSQAQFIEGITYNKGRNHIYYCTKETLVELRPAEDGEWERNVLYEDKNTYFQCLQVNEKGLWAATSMKVFLFQEGQLKQQWDFSKEGNFVHDIYCDGQGNVWLSQSGNAGIKVITDTLTVERYTIPALHKDEINFIRTQGDGVYAVANGANAYLFFKGPDQTLFKDISLPISFPVRGDFNIIDMAIQDSTLWLASTQGLLLYNHKTVRRIDLGEVFTNSSISSVEFLDDENILFSNSYGLFRYNLKLKEFWLFDENSGLPSNTITDHGIFITADKAVWVGTSNGLALAMQSITEDHATVKPYCVDARVNGVPRRFMNGLHASYGAFINLQFSPITFPENKINLQWRLDAENTWRLVENRQISLSDLPPGKHIIYVRAKKNTGQGWSDPTSVNIIVAMPYWGTPWFFLLVLLSIVLIAWASYAISSKMVNQRKDYLQNLIQKRTQELQKANEELTQRNSELDRFVYSASHDLSAPLKSILGLIRVARMDNPGDTHIQYLSMMERSVLKLEEFIQEVVSYSRNTRMPIKWESFNFTEFVEGLLQDHQYSPNYANIRFTIIDEARGNMISDMTRMKIILNNLISNAIKFHWPDRSRHPFVNISLHCEGGQYVITVSDNGRGIEERHLQHIFEMFYRATEDAQGSGLGLYILKESVAKLGGVVEAQSTLNQGTIFKISYPVPALS